MPVLPDPPPSAEFRSTEPADATDAPLMTPAEWALVGLGAAVSLAAVYLTTRAIRSDDDDDPAALGRGDKPGWLLRLLGAPMEDDGQTVGWLRDAILGTSRKGVAKLLGEPRAAGRDGFLVDDPRAPQRSAADVWYYPIGRDRDAAVAVRFEGSKAVDAEFFRSPPVRR